MNHVEKINRHLWIIKACKYAALSQLALYVLLGLAILAATLFAGGDVAMGDVSISAKDPMAEGILQWLLNSSVYVYKVLPPLAIYFMARSIIHIVDELKTTI